MWLRAATLVFSWLVMPHIDLTTQVGPALTFGNPFRIASSQMSYYQFDNSYMLDKIRESPEAPPDQKMRELAKSGLRGFRTIPERRLWRIGRPAMGSPKCCIAVRRERPAGYIPLIGPNALPALDRQ